LDAITGRQKQSESESEYQRHCDGWFHGVLQPSDIRPMEACQRADRAVAVTRRPIAAREPPSLLYKSTPPESEPLLETPGVLSMSNEDCCKRMKSRGSFPAAACRMLTFKPDTFCISELDLSRPNMGLVEPTRVSPWRVEMCALKTHEGTGRTAPQMPGGERPGLRSAPVFNGFVCRIYVYICKYSMASTTFHVEHLQQMRHSRGPGWARPCVSRGTSDGAFCG